MYNTLGLPEWKNVNKEKRINAHENVFFFPTPSKQYNNINIFVLYAVFFQLNNLKVLYINMHYIQGKNNFTEKKKKTARTYISSHRLYRGFLLIIYYWTRVLINRRRPNPFFVFADDKNVAGSARAQRLNNIIYYIPYCGDIRRIHTGICHGLIFKLNCKIICKYCWSNIVKSTYIGYLDGERG